MQFRFWPFRRPDDTTKKIEAILREQLEDGDRKLGDAYWCSEGHNVGKDVLSAASQARAAVLSVPKVADSSVYLQNVMLEVARAKARSRSSDGDPHGYGLSTFNEILANLMRLHDARGKRPLFARRPDELQTPGLTALLDSDASAAKANPAKAPAGKIAEDEPRSAA